MLSNLKTYAIAALAVITGVLAALWQYQRAAFKSAQLKGSEDARETENKDAKATAEGLQDEAKVIDNDNVDADHFS